MSSRWQTLDEIFGEAVRQTGEQRAAFLDRACDGRPSLRAEVERMLWADEAASADFLEHPLIEWTDAAAEGEADDVGLRLDPYRLVERIGAGGMGTVYRAERTDGAFEREVAVKIVRGRIVRPEDLLRFRTERQVLASLDHPNVARLLDGGTTEDGRPFLVMELIDGLPIDRYCATEGLGLHARVELFQQVCAAIEYAHQNFLIHRDVKPDNVLVTADGTVKVLDFGIAKLLEPESLPFAAPVTRTGVRPMTPGYASPEQIRGEPVTTRSEVFVLGVLLYELLTGHSPFVAKGALTHEIEAAICATDGLPAGAALRGDLGAIVGKALRADPEQRYGSVLQLADDLRRFVADLPVSARPETFGYRARKLIQRNRLGTALAAALVLAAGSFVVIQQYQSRRLAEERDKAAQTLGFLVETFKSSDPRTTDGKTVTARQVLETAAARADRDLAEQPEVRASMLDAIGQVYTSLGLLDEAAALLGRALALRRALPGPDTLETAATEYHLAELELQAGDLDAAEPLLRHALEVRQRRLPADAAEVGETLHALGTLLARRDASDEAEVALRQALAVRRTDGDAERLVVAETLDELGNLALRRGNFEEARMLYEDSLRIQRRWLGEHHVAVAQTLAALASVPIEEGQPDEAEILLRDAVAIQREKLPPGHPDLVDGLLNLGRAIHEQGRPAEAEVLYREAIDLAESHSSEPTLRLGDGYDALGSVLTLQRKFADAREAFGTSLAIREQLLGRRHFDVGQNLFHLARLDLLDGDFARAEAGYREAYDIMRSFLGEDHPDVAHPLAGLAETLQRSGRVEEACELFEESLALLRQGLPADHWWIPLRENRLGWCRHHNGEAALAEELLTRSYRALADRFDSDDKRVVDSRNRLAVFYRQSGREKLARAIQEAGDLP